MKEDDEVCVEIEVKDINDILDQLDEILNPVAIYSNDHHEMALRVIQNNQVTAALVVNKLIDLRG